MPNDPIKNVHGLTPKVRIDEALKTHLESELASARAHDTVAADGNSFSRGLIFSKSRPALQAAGLAVDPAIAAANQKLTEATLNSFAQKLAGIQTGNKPTP